MKHKCINNILSIFIMMTMILSMTACSVEKEDTTETTPHFIQTTMFSKSLNLDWTYEIYLPQSYDSSNQTYPVFYLLHGVYGSSANWRNAADLYENADELAKETGDECIIVSMDGMNSFYIDKNIQMESAIINDLMPYIAQNYRITNTKETTFIGGLSMGGYGAARLALKYPEKFGGAILLSPAVWENPGVDDGDLIYEQMGIFLKEDGSFDVESWKAFHPESLLDEYSQKNSPVHFYVATGDEDTIVNIDNVDQFTNNLKTVADVEYVVKSGMGHEWALWKEQVIEGMKYCLSNDT